MRRIALVVIGFLALTGCATTPVEVSTPSGRAEATFPGERPTEVSSRIAALCLDRGHVLVEVSPTAVVCKGDLRAFEATMLQMLIANSYATGPELYYRFTLIGLPDATRVQVYQWVESTMAFGQKRTLEIREHASRNALQAALASIQKKPIAPAPVDPDKPSSATATEAPAPVAAPGGSTLRPGANGVVRLPALPKS